MLALTILANIFQWVFYLIAMYLIGSNPNDLAGPWFLFFLVLICGIICIVGLACGISGIKDRSMRGKSIGTTAVSAIGILTGLIIAIYFLSILALASSYN